MTEDKNIKVRRKPRPKYDQNNKEQANKKRRWKKHHKKPKKDLGKSIEELQAFINSKYHAD